MRILVIGGSYFYGRVFVMEASKEHDVTVLNRGTYTMAEFSAKQIVGDRHNAEVFKQCGENYDAVVDFCAYETGDVINTIENLEGRIGQYILISTVDIYERGAGESRTEEYPLESRSLPGEAGVYIAGKVALEGEIDRVCKDKQIPYTVVRPAILYGPYNYAPRESAYIQMMLQNHALPEFTDSDGRFQFVYVKDAANAVLKCIGNEKTYGQAYNLCQDEILTYDRFFQTLLDVSGEEVRTGLLRVPLTIEEAVEQGVPVPFPATEAETQLCDNTKSKTELGMIYTDFEEGMRRTYNAFKAVFLPS